MGVEGVYKCIFLVFEGDHSVGSAANCATAALLIAVSVLQRCASHEHSLPDAGLVLLPGGQEPRDSSAGTQLCPACQLH